MFEDNEGLFSIEDQELEPYPEPDIKIWYMDSVSAMNQTPIVIGFAGYRRMGKSLGAKLLAESLPKETYTVTTHNFAEPIRKFADQFLNLSITPDTPTLEKEAPLQRFEGKSPREIMQMTGDFFKSIRSDYFTNSMRNLIAEFEAEEGKTGVFLIDDVRFEKEVELIKEFRGQIWGVTEANAAREVAERTHNSDKDLPSELIDLEIEWALDKANPLRSIAEFQALTHLHFIKEFTN